jgi:uncharacterized membrane protein YgcG
MKDGLSSSHRMRLSKLNSSTTYFARINSTNGFGVSSTLASFNFTTGISKKFSSTQNSSSRIEFENFGVVLDLTSNDTLENVTLNMTVMQSNPTGVDLEVPTLSKYINIEPEDEVVSNLSFFIFKVFYTDEDVAGINESNLRLFLFNSTHWVPFDSPVGGVNETGDYVWANRTGFSDYVVGSKYSPQLNISSSPSWSVQEGNQVAVSCSSNSTDLSLHLYRNGAEVSNPDIFTPSSGSYSYICNNTESLTHTSTAESGFLTVSSPPSTQPTSSSGGGGGGGGGGKSSGSRGSPSQKQMKSNSTVSGSSTGDIRVNMVVNETEKFGILNGPNQTSTPTQTIESQKIPSNSSVTGMFYFITSDNISFVFWLIVGAVVSFVAYLKIKIWPRKIKKRRPYRFNFRR